MTTLAPEAPYVPPVQEQPDVPVVLTPGTSGPDRLFKLILLASGLIVTVILGAIVLYLIVHSWPALHQSGLGFITSDDWSPPSSFGILGALGGSVLIALVALVVALPVSVATALMINEFAPVRFRNWLTGVVDLLATVPSIVYGFWGLDALSNYLYGTTVWLDHHASFIPLFRTPSVATYGNSIFVCSMVVAIMIIPIITSITREVMSQTPRETCEAALALGGTRWGMLNDVVLPFSRNGIMGGALLGIGRAMGETMAVLLILSSANTLTWAILGPKGLGSISALIGLNFEQSPTITQSALTLAGLTLFATTLLVNLVARRVVSRSDRKKA